MLDYTELSKLNKGTIALFRKIKQNHKILHIDSVSTKENKIQLSNNYVYTFNDFVYGIQNRLICVTNLAEIKKFGSFKSKPISTKKIELYAYTDKTSLELELYNYICEYYEEARVSIKGYKIKDTCFLICKDEKTARQYTTGYYDLHIYNIKTKEKRVMRHFINYSNHSDFFVDDVHYNKQGEIDLEVRHCISPCSKCTDYYIACWTLDLNTLHLNYHPFIYAKRYTERAEPPIEKKTTRGSYTYLYLGDDLVTEEILRLSKGN